MSAGLARRGARALFGRRADAWLGPVAERAGRGIALALGASLASAALGLATPWLTAQVIDRGILGRDADALIFWACASRTSGSVPFIAGRKRIWASMPCPKASPSCAALARWRR